MKKVVSESGVMFGRAVVVEEGGRGVLNSANAIIGVWTNGKVCIFVGIVLFTGRILVGLKNSIFKINI